MHPRPPDRDDTAQKGPRGNGGPPPGRQVPTGNLRGKHMAEPSITRTRERLAHYLGMAFGIAEWAGGDSGADEFMEQVLIPLEDELRASGQYFNLIGWAGEIANIYRESVTFLEQE